VILEKAFLRTPSISASTGVAYPPSPAIPHLPVSHGSETHENPELLDTNEIGGQDCGINACYLQSLCIWGELVSYLQDLRSGGTDSPWLSSSGYSSLAGKLHSLQINISYRHLFRNVRFPEHCPPDLRRDREYWTPWVSMQVASHSGFAVLNNPFVQLYAFRGANGPSQPRYFLQQTVDQALYHSGWVARFLRECKSLHFRIMDPIVGEMIAATATVPLVFQFATDVNVSERSKADVRQCLEALAFLAPTWPHIERKVSLRPTFCYRD
jgi:hypothetical protein